MSHPILIASLGDWAAAVAALPAQGPLPERTVLVPSERHAHALRRELVRRGAARALAGTRFVGTAAAAAAVLENAGVPFTSGEESLRPARLVALFREDLALQRFDRELLRSTPGWDGAFASAIGDLEAAGLEPSDLPGDDTLLADLSLLWSRAEAEAQRSWTSARIAREAAAILAKSPAAWPFRGPTLAVVGGHETAVVARFLRSIPGVTIGIRAARPQRPHDVDRVGRLFGPEAAALVAQPAEAAAPKTERDLLATYLFERPEVLAAEDRPRSSGPDGTFQLEEHAGVEWEVEAAAEWVARKVLDGVPLEEVAVLVAARDPLAQLVADRLGRLEVAGAPVPVYVAGGVPAASTAAGARMLAAVRAVSGHLAAELLAGILPALRLEDGARAHLTHGEAMELAWSLGIVGGNAANEKGALEWSQRATARVGELEVALRRAQADHDDSSAREVKRLERTLRNLRAVRPALDALVAVARAVVSGAPLAAVWDALSGFFTRWLLTPGEGKALPGRLGEALSGACAGSLGKHLCGADALGAIEDALLSMRVPRGRFGEPAVYVGSVASAAGLEFRAVRILGLCEGVLPSQPHENPVLPEHARAALEASAPGRVLPRARDRVSFQVHALFSAIAGARDEIVLSAPRVDVSRTEREPSATFIEAAAAVARPDASTGEPASAVPNGAALSRDYFAPARRAAEAFRAQHPVTRRAWLARAAGADPLVPPEWSEGAAVALGRVAALRAPDGELGPADGVLGNGDPFPRLPGLEKERPISASALKQLLQCPRLFLMQRILGWDEPAEAPRLRELDPLSFGTLLHRVAEEFYREHGAAFTAHQKSLGSWKKTAHAIAERAFEEFLSEYPLIGERIREKERERLLDALDAFLDYDWKREGMRFVGVELGFGQGTPLEVSAGGVKLWLYGFIDRVDVEDGVTVVRDLKSGGAHPRIGDEEAPSPELDIQLGVYALAAKKLAEKWGTPKKVAGAYVYANGRGDVEERSFREDPAALEKATAAWLSIAAHLLHERKFTPTVDKGDCDYCPFKPLCGLEASSRAAERTEGADGVLARFRALKLGAEEEEDDE